MIAGRLKHSLKERCPECGKVLQVRVRDVYTLDDGIQICTPEDYVACSNQHCEYEREIKQKRRRRQINVLEV